LDKTTSLLLNAKLWQVCGASVKLYAEWALMHNTGKYGKMDNDAPVFILTGFYNSVKQQNLYLCAQYV
jgi:hypothetical protein